jgi:DNA-directed RNA polymerase specialized sigma24 family protein
VLSDGRSALVPKELAEWGFSFSGDAFVAVDMSSGADCWHVSLIKKDFPRSKELKRSYSGFDAESELALIQKCVLRCYRHIFGRFWASDQLEDFTLEVFLHLWVRDCFRRYDSSVGSYETYIQRAVHNCLIDIARSATVQQFRSATSLNQRTDDGDEIIDMLKDVTNQDVVEKMQADALFEKMQARVVELDSGAGDLPGFTYKEIFESLVDGSINDLVGVYPYGKKILNTYISKLRKELESVCYEFAG